jgi:hypothetical protein
MNKQRHRRPSQSGTSPETTPQTGSGVAHFSVSEVVQFSMSVDSLRRRCPVASQQRQGYLHSEGLQGCPQRPHGVGVAGEAVQEQSAETGGRGGH